MTIHILDDLTINQMAAGEVIENTASVIKELVENSLDAHAQSIEVEIQTGGRSYIRVSDDGEGILFSEVPKAILRHATSKLKNFSDLEGLQTLGFRGEALASIASISKISITTATTPASKDLNGSFFVAEGGKIITHVPIYRDKGTTIEVKELFFNTPVRKAFQRSSLFDTQDVTKALTQLALGHPEVSFKLISDKTVVLQLYPSDLKTRASELLGKNFAAKSTLIDVEKEGIKIYGLLGDVNDHRHNRMNQFLLLNQRPIFSLMVSSAVREAYAHAIPEGRFPSFVLHLTLNPEMIDVNVHPQKKEARFRAKGTLSYTITQLIQNALFKQPHYQTHYHPQDEYRESAAKMVWSASLPWEQETTSSPAEIPQFTFEELPPRIIESMAGYLIVDPKTCPKIFEQEEGLGIVDTTAAYDFLFRRNQFPEVTTVPYLIPIEVDVSKEMMIVYEEIYPLLKNLGIEATPFSEKTLLIHSHPLAIKEMEISDLIHGFFEEWLDERGPQKRMESLGRRFSPVLGKRKLSTQEGIYLIHKLSEFQSLDKVCYSLNGAFLDKFIKGRK